MNTKLKFYFLAPSVLSIGFLVSLISIGSDKWISAHLQDSSHYDFYEGLWKSCYWTVDLDSSQYYWQCSYIDIGKSSTLDAVRSLSMISTCLYVITCIVALIAYVKDSFLYSILSAVSALVEALLLVVGLAIYAAKIKQHNTHDLQLDWSFWTGCGSVIIIFLSVGLFVFQASYHRFFKHNHYVPIND